MDDKAIQLLNKPFNARKSFSLNMFGCSSSPTGAVMDTMNLFVLLKHTWNWAGWVVSLKSIAIKADVLVFEASVATRHQLTSVT